MEKIKTLLEAREKQLLKMKKEKEAALVNVPEGSLRVCSHKNRVQYYLRNDPKDFSGHYICNTDRYLAHVLAQKDYDSKVLEAVNKELTAIQKYRSSCPKVSPEQIYNKLHKARKALITPVIKSDAQFIQEWEAVTYQGNYFSDNTPEFFTEKKERVRSKSEIIIADMLAQEGIPYRYEYPLYLDGWGTIYPDFTILNVSKRKEIYWEHLGMMDKTDYAEDTIWRLSLYERSGIFLGDRLIISYETKKSPINQKLIGLKIQKYLK